MAREYKLHEHYINNYEQCNTNGDIKLEDFIIDMGDIVDSKAGISLISDDNTVQDISLENIKVENFGDQLEGIINNENGKFELGEIETIKEEICVQNENMPMLQDDPLLVDNKTHIKLEVNSELSLQTNPTGRENNRDVVFCVECNKTFSHQYYHKIHVHSHAGNTPFNCDICEKSFVKLYLLKTHQLSHSEIRPYSCKVCGKRFKRKNGVTRHEPVHFGDKHYPCDQCDESFKSDNQLKIHKVSHEPKSTICCQQCGKLFPREIKLQQHIRSIHVVKKRYMCSFCGKEFKQKQMLVAHLKSHVD